MKLTIFTPTYNRAHLLGKLFFSLHNQSVKNFEWLILDDGSEDDTAEMVRQFQTKADFPIRYIYQKNQGKHIAINTAVQQTFNELFLTIDSDDEMIENSLEKIAELLPSFVENENIAAICFPHFSYNEKKAKTNKEMNFNEKILDSIQLEKDYGISGEFNYLFKTHILKKYPYPQFPGEKFIKESVVYKRIDLFYKNLYVNQFIVKGEYLQDGLSSDFRSLLERNPNGSALAYLETVNDDRPSLDEKKEAFRNYWYFAKLANKESPLKRLLRIKNKSIIFNFLLQKLK